LKTATPGVAVRPTASPDEAGSMKPPKLWSRVEPEQDDVVAQGVAEVGVSGADDRAVGLDAGAPAAIVEGLGGMVAERRAAVEAGVRTAVGEQPHDVAVVVGPPAVLRRGSEAGDHQPLLAAGAIDDQVPGGVLGGRLDSRKRIVVGVGPAEDDVEGAVVAPVGLGRTGAGEAQEVDGGAAVLVDGVDRRDHVAAGDLDHGQRLLDAAGRQVDLDEAVLAEAGIGGAVGIEATDDRGGVHLDVAAVARHVDLTVGREGHAAQVVRGFGDGVGHRHDVVGEGRPGHGQGRGGEQAAHQHGIPPLDLAARIDASAGRPRLVRWLLGAGLRTCG
jgi:hypothetical protein